jgi:hypothetical protein
MKKLPKGFYLGSFVGGAGLVCRFQDVSGNLGEMPKGKDLKR